MKTTLKTFIALAGVTVLSMSASAAITVKVNPADKKVVYDVESGYIADMLKPKAERPEPFQKSFSAVGGTFTIPTMEEGAAQYVLPVNDREYLVLYTMPGENLEVEISSTEPLQYNVTGSKLMEDISRLDKEGGEILRQYRLLMEEGDNNPEAIESLRKRYDEIYTGYIAANPNAEAVPFALMNLDGEEFLTLYNNLTSEAKESPIYPLVVPKAQQTEKAVAMQKRRMELESGTVMAPAFTFKNADGKNVSLSDFKGKWVIVDFWGSWCRWCIKGFPSLKKAYAEYSPKLEIIGVACNDSHEAWLAALKKYDLPWVNLFNPEQGRDSKLLTDYTVEGFPTKVIVNPEGKIANITVGDDPAFYEILSKLVK